MIIDTHCHLNFKAYAEDCEAIISDMRARDIRGIVVGSQRSTSIRAVEIARANPDILSAAVALHPLHLHSMYVDEIEMPFQTRKEEFDLKQYSALARDPSVVAIGECGLDYYKIPDDISEHDFKKKQHDIFSQHIELAILCGLPIIVHARANPENHRDAYEDILGILKEHPACTQVVVHAFATFPNLAKKFLDAGFLLSFTGLITYPEFPVLPELVRFVPLDRMMLETDAPYMTPQEKRGQRNVPQNVELVARAVASMKGIPLGDVVQKTTHTAQDFFKLS